MKAYVLVGQNRAWLQEACRDAGIKGYSKMTRHQMIAALTSAAPAKAVSPDPTPDEAAALEWLEGVLKNLGLDPVHAEPDVID